MTPGSRSNHASNVFRELVQHTVDRDLRLRNDDRIEENGNARVSRSKLNHARNVCALKQLKYPKHFLQRFVRGIVKLLTHAHDQRGISDGDDFHESVILNESRNPVHKPQLISRGLSTALRSSQDDR